MTKCGYATYVYIYISVVVDINFSSYLFFLVQSIT